MASDKDLQRYFDGELDAAERARVEAALTDDDRERLAALAEMRALVAGALEADAGEVDIWSGVARELGREKQARTRRWRDRARARIAGAGLLVAAAAAFLLVMKPWHPGHPKNDCDIESLDVHGAYASVIQMADLPHSGDTGTTTIIWSEED